MAGGIGKNIKINQNAPLPSGATTLAEDSTLAKVAYSSINPVDYKLPGFSIFHALKMSNPGTPARDYAGTSIAITLLGPQPSDLIFARSGPPTFGALADYLVVHGKENVLKMPDGIDIVAVASLGVAGLTACQCNAPRVKKGSKVFINGDSGGTKSIRSLEADEVIEYRTIDVVKHLQREGTSYDVLIGNVNSPRLYWDAHHDLGDNGQYIDQV